MTEKHSAHIAEDQEILDDFVLDRLDLPRRTKVEEHLNGCPSCREALYKEKLLIAGIRRYGREEFQARLSGNTRGLTVQGAPWPRIVTIAAILLIVVGVGIYDNWFNRQALEVAQSEKRPAIGKPSEALTEELTAPLAEPEKNRISLQEKRRADAEHPSPRREPSLEMKADEGGTAGKLSAAPPVTDARSTLMTDELAARQSQPAQSVAIQLPAPSTAPALQWAQGNIIRDRSSTIQTSAAKENLTKSNGVDKVRRFGGASGEGALMSNVSVTQRPLSQLPPAQQAIQFHQGADMVQALLEEDADSLQVVLYLDPLFEESAVKKATVQNFRGDSLLVKVANLKIGLRLPDGLRSRK